MPENEMKPRRDGWLLVFGLLLLLAGLAGGIGIGYALFKGKPAAAPAPIEVARPVTPANPPASVGEARAQRGNNYPARGGTPDERRARMEERVQAFMDQMPPEQRARMAEVREQVRTNMAVWQNLTPEERQQRMTEFATNNLGMSPDAAQRLQSRFNLTPEQQEQWRQRMQGMRDRNRNRQPPR
jgi:hypothetical protein